LKESKKSSQIKNDINSSQKLMASELRSTEHSLLKKRSKLTIEVEKREEAKQKKIERVRGVSFDSSIGHQSLREVERREPSP